jgi:hypothetical protein
VLNVGCYIGSSTSREIAFARWRGKTIRYLEPITALGPQNGSVCADTDVEYHRCELCPKDGPREFTKTQFSIQGFDGAGVYACDRHGMDAVWERLVMIP